MKKPKRFSAEVKAKALERLASGESYQAICKDIGINGSTIYYWKKRAKQASRRGRAPGVSLATKLVSTANGHTRDAIVYLRHARTAMIRQVVEDKDKLENPVYMFALMALNALEGRS